MTPQEKDCSNPKHIKIDGICTVCGCLAGKLTAMDKIMNAPLNAETIRKMERGGFKDDV